VLEHRELLCEGGRAQSPIALTYEVAFDLGSSDFKGMDSACLAPVEELEQISVVGVLRAFGQIQIRTYMRDEELSCTLWRSARRQSGILGRSVRSELSQCCCRCGCVVVIMPVRRLIFKQKTDGE
jgi:hypothetical protein